MVQMADQQSRRRSSQKAAAQKVCGGLLRSAAGRLLRRLSGPLVRWTARHQVTIRRLGGSGMVAIGAGFMAGGLDPLGLSLVFLGTAVLVLEWDQSRRRLPHRQDKRHNRPAN